MKRDQIVLILVLCFWVFYSKAMLKVYDVKGSLVKMMKHHSRQTITFQRNQLTVGFYFPQLLQEGKVAITDKLEIID